MVFCSLVWSGAKKSKLDFGLYGGVSQAVGEGSENMNLGINLGTDALYPLNDYFSYGGALDYHVWKLDNPEILNVYEKKEFIEIVFTSRFSTRGLDNFSYFLSYSLRTFFFP